MERTIIYVDNFLTGSGHTPTTGATLVKLFKQEGYNVIKTSSKENKALRLADMLFTIIKNRKNATVLIATYSTSAFYFACTCGFICRLFNVPYIPCLHGGNLPARIKNSPKLSQSYFGKSYMNVAVSAYLMQSMDANNWKCIEIPNNINLADYPFKSRKNINPAILWVRSFHEIYNPTLALKVIKKLSTTIPNVTLTMVGPDKDGSLNTCKELVKQLEIEDKVIFTGLLSRQEWTQIAATHDIFINTTNFDNLPVSVVEAMALGMIVISTRVGGVPFLVDENTNGILVNPNDEAAFVKAIQEVLSNVSMASALSPEARKKAEKYDWNNIKILWRELLNNITNN